MSKWPSFREARAKDRWREHYKRELAKLHKLSTDLGNFGPRCPASQIFRLAEQIEQNLKLSDLPLPLVMATSEGGIQVKWRKPDREFSVFIYPDTSLEYLFSAAWERRGGATDTAQVNDLVERFLG